MTDMSAFERLVAAEVQVEAGPSRPTDVAAVIRAATTKPSRWRFQTMFSATKYVVAGVVVALFGGVLLAGVLPNGQQPDQVPGSIATPLESPTGTTRGDILPDYLHVEEFEPGVFRVESDGFRTFARQVDQADLADMQGFLSVVRQLLSHWIMAGLDGSLWYMSEDELFRLGDPEPHDWGGDQGVAWFNQDAEVGPDGRIWQVGSSGSNFNMDSWLRSYDGERWTIQKRIKPSPQNSRVDGHIDAVEVTSEGTIWSSWVTNKLQRRVARLDGDDWVVFDVPGHGDLFDPQRFAAGSDEDVWIHAGRLLRLEGDVLEPVDRPDGDGDAGRFDVGPDGTVWMLSSPRGVIARYDGTDWKTFDESDGIPLPSDHFMGYPGIFEVAADGSIWFDPADPDHVWACNGIANFDGTRVRHYLQDYCFYGGDIAPDGTAYVLAGTWGGARDVDGMPTEPEAGPVHLFAIPPASPQ